MATLSTSPVAMPSKLAAAVLSVATVLSLYTLLAAVMPLMAAIDAWLTSAVSVVGSAPELS